MAMTINPGYDFQVTEIPTRAKLQAMIAGISLTKIDVSQIDATLVLAKYGETSVSLPGEGWMWVDPIGNIWCDTRWGRTKLIRALGGLSTIRFSCNVVDDTYGSLPRNPVDARGAVFNRLTGDTNESNIVWRLRDAVEEPGSYRADDTQVSGQHRRWTLRGGTIIPIGPTGRQFPDLFTGGQSAGAINYERDPIPITNPTRARNNCYFGIALRQNAAAGQFAFAWHYGLGVRLL